MATGFLTALHWDQARALVDQDTKKADFRLRPKRRDPLSRLLLLGAVGAFGALPYAEEMWRCVRARPTRPNPRPPNHPPK
jgi:hypothetical protein